MTVADAGGRERQSGAIYDNSSMMYVDMRETTWLRRWLSKYRRHARPHICLYVLRLAK